MPPLEQPMCSSNSTLQFWILCTPSPSSPYLPAPACIPDFCQGNLHSFTRQTICSGPSISRKATYLRWHYLSSIHRISASSLLFTPLPAAFPSPSQWSCPLQRVRHMPQPLLSSLSPAALPKPKHLTFLPLETHPQVVSRISHSTESPQRQRLFSWTLMFPVPTPDPGL